MEDMNELQMTCFEIISYVGTAKSMYINAVQKAKEGDFDAAEELIKQGDEAYNGGHDVHMGLLKKEANGERNGEAPLILLHAEDQMAGTETCASWRRSSSRFTSSCRYFRPSRRYRRDGPCGPTDNTVPLTGAGSLRLPAPLYLGKVLRDLLSDHSRFPR